MGIPHLQSTELNVQRIQGWSHFEHTNKHKKMTTKRKVEQK